MSFPIVEESTVLKKTTDFLINRGVIPYRFSVARGRGINSSEVLSSISQKFASAGINPVFSASGADIEGISEKEWWRIECKGSGSGTSQTQRNNFDRALASVVTYFELPPYTLLSNSEEVKNAKLFLGLALPASPHYLRELKQRVRPSLRMHLNLWILLYDPVLESVKDFAPNHEF